MKYLLATIVTFLFTLTARAQSASSEKPFVLGAIVQLPSKELSETRTLNIYLPEGYNPDSATTYPVIYLLDGSADEDFIHISGLVQFCNFPWVDIIPKSIVVGVANVSRQRDFTYPSKIANDKQAYPIKVSGGSPKFISFLDKELIPYINRHYKTSGNATLIGQSLGGLLATEVLFKHPQLFNNYLIISPSLWWDNGSLLAAGESSRVNAFPGVKNVFVAVGKEGEIMETGARRLADMLSKQSTIKSKFSFYEHEDHASIMHLAAYDGFKFIGKNR